MWYRARAIFSRPATRTGAQGAKSVTFDKLPERYRIDLHADLRCTVHYCPASGAQLAVDFHRKGEAPSDDLMLDLTTLPRLAA